jgi:hypothetical protein
VSTAALALAGLVVACLVPVLWATGRIVTRAGAKVSGGVSEPRQYLAGRLDGVLITYIADSPDGLLVRLTAQGTGPSAGLFCVTAAPSPARVWRWRVESTPLRAYLSRDEAIMLADPVLGGNAACEPLPTYRWPASEQANPRDHSPTDG